MLSDPAARRYARAAFELGRERDELDGWEADLRAFGEALASEEAIVFLGDYKIPADAKEHLLHQVVRDPKPLVWNLVRVLESKGRLGLLSQVAEQFQALLDEHRGIAHAQVLTAVAMDDEERQALANRLSEVTGKQVLVEAFEEPEILGGLVARIGDRLIDGSTRSRLLALKRQLAGGTR